MDRSSSVCVHRMERKELELAISWAAAEGWNPGRRDADCFHAADRNGFFTAYLDGEPAGCISAVAYDDSFGFMGMYIVRPELRGKGIGMQLWQAALEYLGDRTIGADGVLAMLDKYAKSGFRIAHENARYEGVGRRSGARCSDLADLSFAELERYDRRFFPAPRSEFLKAWIRQPGSRSLAVTTGGALAGYGTIRPCRNGFKIAPLCADSPEIAEELFSALSSQAEGQAMFLDIPIPNVASRELVEQHAMTKVFETARIYRGPAPSLPLERIYGICSFELG